MLFAHKRVFPLLPLERLHVDSICDRVGNIGRHATQHKRYRINPLVGIARSRVARKAQQAVFGGCVGGTGIVAPDGGNGANVDDDAPGLLRRELRNGGATRVVRSVQVDAQDAVPEVARARVHRAKVVHDAGVVDEDVDGAEFGDGGGEQGLYRGLVCHVGDGGEKGCRLVARGCPFLLGRAQARGADVADGYAGAGGEEGCGGDFAETAACAGDEHRGVLWTHFPSPPGARFPVLILFFFSFLFFSCGPG